MIVDASALVTALRNAKSARTIADYEVSAPDLLVAETLNAFWKLARAGQTVPERSTILRVLDQIRLVPSRPHAGRAAQLAEQLDHSVYDCLYLALAEAEADVLITADARLERKARAGGLSKRVRLMPQ